MAESRRVQLTTLTCDEPSSSQGSAQKSPPCDLQEKGSDGPADTGTVRLVLSLFEPDDRSFPEFSYSQLVENKIGQVVKDKVPLSRFEKEEKKENDEMVALARRLENKYSEKPKKKKDRIQDLIDIGYGYDDEDSFIDNSEAYDEFVPASITTKFGGFYVNSGVLQFRQASDTETEDRTTVEETLEASKKRKLNVGQDKPKKKPCREDGEIESSVDANSSSLSETVVSDEKKKKKKKKVAGTLSVTRMLKKFQKEKERERQKMEKANQKAAAIMGARRIPLYPADAAGGGGSGLTDPLLSLIGFTNDHALIQAASTEDFDIDLDSLLDVTEDTSSLKTLPQPARETQLHQPKIDYLPQASASSEVQLPNRKTNSQLKPPPEQIQLMSEASPASPLQYAPLPEGLPPQLEDRIRKLTLAAKTSEGESKLKFFTPEINSILLDIECQCREQGGQLRSKVYTHLSSFLPCSRETLLKRVKKLLLTHSVDPPNVEDPMQRLQEAIGRSMPEQIACFNKNCQAYEQGKTSKTTEEGKCGTQSMSAGPEDNVEEKGGKRGGPKKLFKWNEEIRECLVQVLTAKMDRYKKEKKGSQEEEEEYLKTLLDNEVKPLWPKGWMQSRVLTRESRKMLGLFTSLPVKKAKTEKKQSSISGAPTTSDGYNIFKGTPPLKGELPQETDDVLIEGSNISSLKSLGAAKKEFASLKNMEGKTGGGMVLDADSSPSVEKNKPLINGTCVPARSLLDVLADQALARQYPLSVSQELLAAAVTKYRRSVKHWNFSIDTKSPPFPPPPPQSSPVGFPVSGLLTAPNTDLQTTEAVFLEVD
ncbi:ubinuclein-1-like [Scomber scombrus]|uniref:Ubinuclein-1-like n=1 Tax=Scomber scombrus TaxID=13677 RepID=A0AAV1PQ12_SCOSC